MRFVLLVEGHTEKALPAFLKRWLDPRLPQPVRITPIRFEGWRHYRKEVDKKVAINLSGKAGADVLGAIGLLDLYGPDLYPAGQKTLEERRNWAKRLFEEQVDHPRFRQHFAVHETEAWRPAGRHARPGGGPIAPRDVSKL